MTSETAARDEFGVHDYDYYRDALRVFGGRGPTEPKALLLLAHHPDHGEEPIAGLIVFAFGREAIYMYGASSTKHRAHGAGFYLQFEAMRWAREHGCRWYDLWGIPAADPFSTVEDSSARVAPTRGDDWRGLYRFKVGFGGDIVSYPPTLERRYAPVLSWLARRAYADRG